MSAPVMHTFVRDEVLPSWWANAIQKFIGTIALARLRQVDNTTIEIEAAAGEGAAGVAIAGRWRWNEATVQRAHPGGAAGTYDVFVTAKDNSFSNVPVANTDTTDYSFALAIVTHNATPALSASVEIFRKIGELTWSGAAITSLVQTRGPSVGGRGGTAYIASFEPLREYDLGDVIRKDGVLYEPKVAFTAGAVWNANDWVLLSADKSFGGLVSRREFALRTLRWDAVGMSIPAGALDRWFSYVENPANSAAERKEVVVFGDSTAYGAGGLYSWLQEIRNRLVGAGHTDGGKGIFGVTESEMTYDAPEVNGFVSSTFAGGPPDTFDPLGGAFYYDNGAVANRTLTLRFRSTCFRLWYSSRANVGDFTYSVNGGAPVTVHAYDDNSTNTQGPKFVYVSGLAANTTHTITITNLAGRTADPPNPLAGGYDSGSYNNANRLPINQNYYYVATSVFSGVETTPTAVLGPLSTTQSGGTFTFSLPNNGRDSHRIYRSTSPAGPFEFITSTRLGGSGTVDLYKDSTDNVLNPAQNPPAVNNAWNSSAKECYVTLAPMNDKGISVQKYATSGLRMDQFGNGAPGIGYGVSGWKTVEALGLRPAAGLPDLTNPANLSIDTLPVVAGRIKPVLALLELGFNDLSAATNGDMTKVGAAIKKFAVMCQVAGCDGIVISGQLPVNANWNAYGAAMFAAMRDAAILNGLAFVDFWNGPLSSADKASINQPHLTKAQYIKQADWLWDALLGATR